METPSRLLKRFHFFNNRLELFEHELRTLHSLNHPHHMTAAFGTAPSSSGYSLVRE
jgi:hypothetical protein